MVTMEKTELRAQTEVNTAPLTLFLRAFLLQAGERDDCPRFKKELQDARQRSADAAQAANSKDALFTSPLLQEGKDMLNPDKPQVPIIGKTLGDISDSMSPLHRDDAVYVTRTANIVYVFLTLLALFVYIFVGGIIFMAYESDSEWTLIDGWYFAVVTIATVGYGVLTPSTDGCRFFVCVFLIFGMVFFVFVISIFTEYILLHAENKMRSKLMADDQGREESGTKYLCWCFGPR